jgi:hypothetical protein
LKKNNKVYQDIALDDERLLMLPEDGIPEEILAVVRHEKDDDVVERECETYIPSASNDVSMISVEEREGEFYLICKNWIMN